MGIGKKQGYIVSPISIWFASFLFHMNETNNSEIQLFKYLTLKDPRSMSWVTSSIKATSLTQYRTKDIDDRVFDLEKHIQKFEKKSLKKLTIDFFQNIMRW